MKNSRVALVIEDEVHIASLLKTNLSLDGFEVIVVDTGKKALDTIGSRHIDIILLDVMLPDCNGVDLCRKIKHSRSEIPIIILSALGQVSDRIKGLKSGADDYLPKPFDLEELQLRIEKLISRGNKITVNDIVQIGNAEVDFKNLMIKTKNSSYSLTSKESLLLKFMFENANKVLSRELILNNVWGFEHFPNTRTIDNFIAHLRKFIETDPNSPRFITTVRGVGYKLNL